MTTIQHLEGAPPQPPPEQWKATLLTAVAVGVVFFFLAIAYTSLTPRGTPPDERGHITYVHEASTSPYLMPDYRNSRILPQRKGLNQLRHPPLYYSTLGAVAKAFDLEAYEDYRVFRMLSAVLVAMGLALWIVTARLLGYTLLQSIPLALSVIALPMFPYLAGSINNDNLAYLAASVAFLGLASLRHWPRAGWYIGAAGLGMALLTKATAGLFLGLLFGLWCMSVLLRNPQRLLRNRHFGIVLVALVLIVGGYYLFTYTHYGTLFPSSKPVHEGPQIADPMGFVAFLGEFFGLMLQHVPMIVNHRPAMPLDSVAKTLCLASIFLPFLGVLLSNLTNKRTPATGVANIMMVTLALTVATHVMVSWETYLELGQIRGTQPRYYFYLLPAIATFAFSGFARSRALKVAYRAFALIAVAMSIAVPIASIATIKVQNTPTPAIRFPLYQVSTDKPRQLDFEHRSVGSVRRTVKSPDSVLLRGWAIDQKTADPAARLDIYYHGQRIGSVSPNKPRPDVAFALDDNDARNAGFEVMIEGIPPTVSPCDFRYVAIQESGQPFAIGAAANCKEIPPHAP